MDDPQNNHKKLDIAHSTERHRGRDDTLSQRDDRNAKTQPTRTAFPQAVSQAERGSAPVPPPKRNAPTSAMMMAVGTAHSSCSSEEEEAEASPLGQVARQHTAALLYESHRPTHATNCVATKCVSFQRTDRTHGGGGGGGIRQISLGRDLGLYSVDVANSVARRIDGIEPGGIPGSIATYTGDGRTVGCVPWIVAVTDDRGDRARGMVDDAHEGLTDADLIDGEDDMCGGGDDEASASTTGPRRRGLNGRVGLLRVAGRVHVTGDLILGQTGPVGALIGDLVQRVRHLENQVERLVDYIDRDGRLSVSHAEIEDARLWSIQTRRQPDGTRIMSIKYADHETTTFIAPFGDRAVASDASVPMSLLSCPGETVSDRSIWCFNDDDDRTNLPPHSQLERSAHEPNPPDWQDVRPADDDDDGQQGHGVHRAGKECAGSSENDAGGGPIGQAVANGAAHADEGSEPDPRHQAQTESDATPQSEPSEDVRVRDAGDQVPLGQTIKKPRTPEDATAGPTERADPSARPSEKRSPPQQPPLSSSPNNQPESNNKPLTPSSATVSLATSVPTVAAAAAASSSTKKGRSLGKDSVANISRAEPIPATHQMEIPRRVKSSASGRSRSGTPSSRAAPLETSDSSVATKNRRSIRNASPGGSTSADTLAT